MLGTLVQRGRWRWAARGGEHGVHIPSSLGGLVEGIARSQRHVTGTTRGIVLAVPRVVVDGGAVGVVGAAARRWRVVAGVAHHITYVTTRVAVAVCGVQQGVAIARHPTCTATVTAAATTTTAVTATAGRDGNAVTGDGRSAAHEEMAAVVTGTKSSGAVAARVVSGTRRRSASTRAAEEAATGAAVAARGRRTVAAVRRAARRSARWVVHQLNLPMFTIVMMTVGGGGGVAYQFIVNQL